MTIALTGGTGFLGGAVLDRLLVENHPVRALARRPQALRTGVEWVLGDLDDRAALDRLVADCAAVIHVAGAINAPDRAAFHDCNAGGTARLVAAARDAACGRFVLVSSLSAREPALSDYGWSKREGERAVETSGLDCVVVRPPAIYGPGDREMLEMFRMAARGVVPLPPGGRLSVIHADDLAVLLVRLAGGGPAGTVLEVDDGTPGGWTHRDFARALGAAVGRKHVAAIPLPRAVLQLGSLIDGLVRGRGAKLTADRVRYFCHPDWVARPDRQPPPTFWTPRIATAEGLAATAAAYRASGWLR